ncbi:hypothetical protein [Neobacillus drentensis]|uniref:hypothetical protein n=1 Tax=Neobacillus drentensis TaxID=220684 RepID=UPI002855D436|nr:hypothetical protein [Neobacillus drentensis]MDR7235787.1 hypothetical protein [Neobacillus drentensis]
MKELKENNNQPGPNNNKNDVRVNNNFSLTINLGDSLNLFALIGSICIVKRLVKKRKAKRKKMQWP